MELAQQVSRRDLADRRERLAGELNWRGRSLAALGQIVEFTASFALIGCIRQSFAVVKINAEIVVAGLNLGSCSLEEALRRSQA